MDTKLCSKCKSSKTLDNYYKDSKAKTGYKSSCKDCCRISKKESNYRPSKCSQCGEGCWGRGDNIICHKCRADNTWNKYCNTTLEQAIYEDLKSAKYSYVRFYARKKAQELGWNKCHKCGYDKHFEVAHIKPISSFSLDTLLPEINHEDNLIPLCPNCHWEFDNL